MFIPVAVGTVVRQGRYNRQAMSGMNGNHGNVAQNLPYVVGHDV